MHNDEIGIVTRSGERRLRWLAAVVALPLFGVVAAFGTVEHVPESIPVRTVIEPLALSATPVGDSGTVIYFQEDRFRRSDTLTTLIERLGADEDEAATLLRSSRGARPFRLLLPGTTVQAKLDQVHKLRSISFLTDRDTILSVDRLGESFGRFEQQAEVARGMEMKSGEIETSLFAATDAAGIPDGIAVEIADIFGGDMDFHRDLRRHPIFQQWRAHQGVDYGAQVGTRVKSTGDGVVSFAGRRNGYGNLIVIRHHTGYSTYYAHLRNFALRLRAGSRVVQGEIIGYVGQTGWASGPHLHYEFHLHNQNRNPLTMAFPAAQPILAIELAAFRRTAEPLIARLDLLKNGDLALLE